MTNSRLYFTTNKENYSIHTRHSNDTRVPQTNLAIYQKGVFIQMLKYLIIFHHILKILLAILRDLKEF